ncbi:MAG: flagellar protein FliT [Rhodocyclaceae bacterium]|nr:flagellar protein FliT [Rhodocyclaceae bacterium]
MSVLARYQNLLDLSQEMALLATEQAWDKLGDLQAKRATLIASLPPRLNGLPDAEQRAIAGIIQQILRCDETIQEYLVPWREQVGILLSHLQPKQNNAA